jgi:hypothetical protein
MHPGTTRGLGDWTMVKEAIRIAHSDCGVAKFASSGRLLASNETPFDRKNSSFWIWMTCPMLFIHPPQPKYTSRDKKMSGPLSPEYGTYQNTAIRPPTYCVLFKLLRFATQRRAVLSASFLDLNDSFGHFNPPAGLSGGVCASL